MADFIERPRKLIHKKLQSQYIDTLHKCIRNISRNMHKSRSSQLLPLPKYIEETHEALSAVQVQTSSKEQFLLVNDSEKILLCFLVKPTCSFLAPLMFCTYTGHSNQHRSFFTNISWTQQWSLCAACIFPTGQ
jgi:hypothetical protein